jgi:hypothetical protein
MTERRLYLDVGAGESRAVVTLDGRPERLLIVRDGDLPFQALGARLVARVRTVDRANALAFLDLGAGPDAVLNLTKDLPPLPQGIAVEVEIRSEARRDKGANVRFLGPAEGSPRLLEPPPSIEAQLKAFAPAAEIRTGSVARSVADGAQDEALSTVFALPGGGSVAIEATRALTAVDVDLGGRPGVEPKRAARSANFAALSLAARVLRLKGLGGLVVVDMVGRGHDAPALLSAARAAFGPDNPGVAFGALSRFGTLELTVPRRARPAMDRLTDQEGRMSVETEALALLRALEREAIADGGGRFEAVAEPAVAEAALSALSYLIQRLGARISVRADIHRSRGRSGIVRL